MACAQFFIPFNVCHAEAKACNFRLLFNINGGLVLLKLADTVLILIKRAQVMLIELLLHDEFKCFLKEYLYFHIFHNVFRKKSTN